VKKRSQYYSPFFDPGLFVQIMLMIGSSGTGKSILAQRLATILPPLTPVESLETTRIYSAMGRLPADEPLRKRLTPLRCVRGSEDAPLMR
jgi:predicted ATPase with chaperone activity